MIYKDIQPGDTIPIVQVELKIAQQMREILSRYILNEAELTKLFHDNASQALETTDISQLVKQNIQEQTKKIIQNFFDDGEGKDMLKRYIYEKIINEVIGEQ
jgi:hypothetical protein